MGLLKTGFKVVVPAILIAQGSLALATPREGAFRSKGSGYWEQVTAWEVFDPGVGWRDAVLYDGIPGIDHVVTLQAGHTVVVSGHEQVGKLLIERGADNSEPGTLEIAGGGMLTVHRSFNMAKRPKGTASARLVFSGSGNRPGVLLTAGNLGIYGDVEVIGDAGGVLRTARAKQNIFIGRHARLSATSGPLIISGTLEMDGKVIADGPYAVIVTGLAVGKGSSGKWEISHPEASIRFATARPVSLRAGEITIKDGTLDIATSFESKGRVIQTGGRIQVDENCTFEAKGLSVDVQRGGARKGSEVLDRAGRR